MKKYGAFAIAFFIVLIGVFGGFLDGFSFQQKAQTQTQTTPTPDNSSDKISRPTSDPYTGDLARFDRENRAGRLQIERVMDILEIKVGKSVADIGAGGGWFTMIAAKRVGEKGKVFAVDINPESKNFIDERAKKEALANIETIISEPADPLLPENSVDAVLILNTYHEFSEPVILLKNLKRSLKRGALVGIIDRNGDGGDHGIDNERVIGEVYKAGFRFKEKYDFVSEDQMDYFLVFKLGEADR